MENVRKKIGDGEVGGYGFGWEFRLISTKTFVSDSNNLARSPVTFMYAQFYIVHAVPIDVPLVLCVMSILPMKIKAFFFFFFIIIL